MSKWKNKPWFYKRSSKVIAYILLVLFVCATAASMLGVVFMWDFRVYSRDADAISRDVMEEFLYRDAYNVFTLHERDGEKAAQEYCKAKNLAVSLYQKKSSAAGQSGENQLIWHYGSMNAAVITRTDNRFYDDFDQSVHTTYDLDIGLCQPLAQPYAALNSLIHAAHYLRYWIYAFTLFFLAAAVFCFVYLITAAGHRPGVEGIVSGPLQRFPWDAGTLIFLIAELCLTAAMADLYYSTGWPLDIISVVLLLLVNLLILPLYGVDLAVRIKAGGMLRKTVCFRLGKVLWRGLKFCGRKTASGLGQLPLIWKTAVTLAVICLLEFMVLVAFWYQNASFLAFFWFLEKLVLVPVILYITLILRRLHKASQALAGGDLSYQADTKGMFWDFKTHGENLNCIAQGMNQAVEERLKSERMKTELITNVSHDIKTPLTSIINYADLIGKEPANSHKIREYSDVLLRQSVRLKRLLENLVEASKASTGNLEVNLVPCEIGVLLTQITGEYSQRLQEKGLELIVSQPKEPLYMMADSRHLWRVMDNLMNNILNYALTGTRAYLTVEKTEQEVTIAFKNISSAPLNISTDELLERFVRGDRSRNTEGNGLGLSIAQSLTELQKGRLELTVDGDLFKVLLHFPRLS